MNDISMKCEHVLHDNGIHEFVINDFSMLGADAFFTHLEYLYQYRTDASEPLRLLIDSGKGALPISYMIQRGKEVNARFPYVGATRIVVLTGNAVEARLADSLLRMVRFHGSRVRFFDPSRRAAAAEWLLHDD